MRKTILFQNVHGDPPLILYVHVRSIWFTRILLTMIQVDLKKLGITDYGELESGQLGQCANNKLELFFPGRVKLTFMYNIILPNVSGLMSSWFILSQ